MTNIHIYRKKRGLTQRELADLMGLNRSTITKWELGYCNPSIPALIKLAKILNCSVDNLIFGGLCSLKSQKEDENENSNAKLYKEKEKPGATHNRPANGQR